MKRNNCQVLVFTAVAVILFGVVVPCAEGWYYIGSGVSNDPPDGYAYDDDSGPTWCWEWEEAYEVTGIETDGDSSGAWASADATASCNGSVMTWGAGAPPVSPYAWGGTQSWSDYGNNLEDINDPLYISWGIGGSGEVEVNGYISGKAYLGSGDSASSSASAAGGIAAEDSGAGSAYGGVSDAEDGSASVGLGGCAEEGSSTVDDGYYDWYHARLGFTIEGGEPNDEKFGLSYSVQAEVGAWSSCSAGLSVADFAGEAGASAYANCGGYSWVGVAW